MTTKLLAAGRALLCRRVDDAQAWANVHVKGLTVNMLFDDYDVPSIEAVVHITLWQGRSILLHRSVATAQVVMARHNILPQIIADQIDEFKRCQADGIHYNLSAAAALA